MKNGMFFFAKNRTNWLWKTTDSEIDTTVKGTEKKNYIDEIRKLFKKIMSVCVFYKILPKVN